MRTERATIAVDRLELLFRAIREHASLFAPVASARDGRRAAVELLPITDETEASVVLDYPEITTAAAKAVFFPQREVLLYSRGDAVEQVEPSEKPIVLFGVRPCDARSLACLDRIFDDPTGRFPDPYYLRRRQDSVIIALACREPQEGCFCTAVGGGPAGTDGCDVVAFVLGEKLLFEAVSETGASFLQAHDGLFQPAGPQDQQERDALVRDAEVQIEATMGVDRIDPTAVREKLDASFDDSIWQEITRECLGCGACTYLCPTCHCFDITDETNCRGCGIRIRSWDSCQYPLFTLHASGHNPRVNRTQRLRQRIMHKFSYTVQTQERVFCVGCGRCVRHCPVNLDIREALTRLAGISRSA